MSPVNRPGGVPVNVTRASTSLALLLLVLGTLPIGDARVVDTGLALEDAAHAYAVIANGNQKYILGGAPLSGTPSDLIQVLQPAPRDSAPSASDLRVHGVPLPHPLYDAAAAVHEGTAYIFGGHSGSARLAEIVAFNTNTGGIRVLDAQLPEPVQSAAAVTVGDAIYVLGGLTGPGSGSDAIHRFDPATETLTTLSTTLPGPIGEAAAVEHQGMVYLLGGLDPTGENLPRTTTVRFDPAAGTVDEGGRALHTPVRSAAVAWDGTRAIILGGFAGEPLDLIQFWSPTLAYAFHEDHRLPEPSWGGSATIGSGRVYLIGGTHASSDHILAARLPGDPPSASFTTATEGLAVEVDGSSSTSPDGSITSWSWDWGDGTTDQGATASHTYGAPGEYRIVLQVADDAGSSAAHAETVTVGHADEAPIARFTPTVDDLTVTVDASASSDPDGDIVTYLWDWGDGRSEQGTQPTATHTYEQDGTYQIELTVVDGGDRRSTATATIEASPAPEVEMAIETTVDAMTVTADAVLVQGSFPGPPEYLWDWGDGARGIGIQAVHSYDRPGEHVITLTVQRGGTTYDTTNTTVLIDHPGWTGTVRDDAGTAAAGAALVLLGPDGDRYVPRGTTTTDDEGRWTLEDADGAEYVGLLGPDGLVLRPLPGKGGNVPLVIPGLADRLPDPRAAEALQEALVAVRVLDLADGPEDATVELDGFAGLERIIVTARDRPAGAQLAVADLEESGPDGLIPPRGVAHDWAALTLIDGDGNAVPVDRYNVTFHLPARTTASGPAALGLFDPIEEVWGLDEATTDEEGLHTAEATRSGLLTLSTLPAPLLVTVSEALTTWPWGLLGSVLALATVGLPVRARLRRQRLRAAPRKGRPGRAAGPVLELDGVMVSRGGRPVLTGISAGVREREVVALLGGSGAGKSTLLKAIVGEVPFLGSIRVLGSNRGDRGGAPDPAIGYVPQDLQLYPHLTVAENARYFGAQFGLSRAERRERTTEALRALGLADLADRRVSDLSGGERRRASIAATLVQRPRLLILDEPTSGLDPVTRRSFWRHLTRIREDLGVTILVTTHFVDEAERADRIAILSDGLLVALGTPTELLRSLPGGGRVLVAEMPDLDAAERDRLVRTIRHYTGAGHLLDHELVGNTLRVFAEDPERVEAPLRQALTNADLAPRHLAVRTCRMEDVFVHQTGRSWDEDGDQDEDPNEELPAAGTKRRERTEDAP